MAFEWLRQWPKVCQRLPCVLHWQQKMGTEACHLHGWFKLLNQYLPVNLVTVPTTSFLSSIFHKMQCPVSVRTILTDNHTVHAKNGYCHYKSEYSCSMLLFPASLLVFLKKQRSFICSCAERGCLCNCLMSELDIFLGELHVSKQALIFTVLIWLAWY